MPDRILKVKFKARQSGEDLYYCEETKRVYCRQPANVPGIVFWLTTCKWSGGYEADCPMREGLTLEIEKDGQTYQETLLPGDEWVSSTRAEKKFKFSWEEEREACQNKR